ncbi:MAG: Uridylate kinase [Methanosaeta sp. PtaB.Bin039]|nr:MAG: Uridylate kinase [Methanosaeta sp. PtaB.Bin039]OPY45909.1 MAG: Uridylate kinase [Methanosaeta sp. PtaU1.Bin028]HOT06156.1 UMP kinase [Methanotrichaceae archaeon]HQF15534.1 UMP kinase [Methanotrichaceae archaeon]HQI90269.1 UMP kinase [Methanotrichaceae archaeon]
MIIVYSLGGSLLAEQDSDGLRRYAEELRKLAKEHSVYVVVGGGRYARTYIEKARALGTSETFCDMIGINISKVNAMLLMAALGEDTAAVPEDYLQAAKESAPGKVVVMGGVAPGQTTDAVSALLAELVRADRLIVATNVDGVYTADPKVDSSAEKFDRMTPGKLVEISMMTEMKAGSKSAIDPLAAKIIERSSIPTAIVNGSDIANLRKAIFGDHQGTEIALK